MKITKETLKQLIKEELASFQDGARGADETWAADAKVVNRAAIRGPDGEDVELERTAGMSNEEWENAKRVAMGGSPKKKLSYRQKHDKEQDRRVAIHKGRKERAQERASMLAKGGAPVLEDVLAEDDTMDPMGADEFSRFANVPGYEDERVPGKTASQVRRRDLPPEEFKYDDSHLRDLGYLEEIIREETEAVLSEDRVLTKLEADLKKYIGRKKKENDAERKATLQKTIDNLKQKIRARKKR